MEKIIVKSFGIIHCHAMCMDCKWSDSDYENRAGLRSKVRKHVRETGHKVSIESGKATHYSLEGSK